MKKSVIVVCLLLCATAEAATNTRIPHIIKDATGFDRCQPDDPAGPCNGRLLTVKNPMRRPQVVTVECRGGLRDTAVIRKGRSVTFDLGSGSGSLYKSQCAVASFYPWKKSVSR